MPLPKVGMMTKYPEKKILLVDDEPNIVLALEFLMNKEGFRVSKAFDGPSALELAKQECPDLVILDVMMPGMDGFEVARHLRETDTLEGTSILFLTAKGTPSDKLEGYSSGGEVYLTKPFDNDELVETVRELLEFG